MTALAILIPISIFMGLAGLIAFLWAMKTRQYEDLDGAANRILFEEETRLPQDPKDQGD
ncbi:MAG TPA: cbb3-type cytochrome oxidase assembly protein CcoS [Alphaproteobacteria bacterium]|nr:cbb3-type cytochrome oxidase assembly protein CcoS [Alphaproteobacteria bacterium]